MSQSKVNVYVSAIEQYQDPATENTYKGVIARALVKKWNDNIPVARKHRDTKKKPK